MGRVWAGFGQGLGKVLSGFEHGLGKVGLGLWQGQGRDWAGLGQGWGRVGGRLGFTRGMELSSSLDVLRSKRRWCVTNYSITKFTILRNYTSSQLAHRAIMASSYYYKK